MGLVRTTRGGAGEVDPVKMSRVKGVNLRFILL